MTETFSSLSDNFLGLWAVLKLCGHAIVNSLHSCIGIAVCHQQILLDTFASQRATIEGQGCCVKSLTVDYPRVPSGGRFGQRVDGRIFCESHHLSPDEGQIYLNHFSADFPTTKLFK